MNWLIHFIANAVVFLIAAKYLLIILGYCVCFFASRALRSGVGRTAVSNRNKTGAPESQTPSLFFRFGNLVKRMISGWFSFSLLYTGRIPSQRVRNFIYRRVYGLRMAPKTILYGRCEIRAPYNIAIGKGTIIGDECKLDGRNGITIGKSVNFSTGVWIWTDQHDPQCPYFSCTDKGGPVIIGDRVWVSCRAVILPRVTIGEGAVIAAGAVVTGDVEPFAIYGGVPARKIGERNRNLLYEFDADPLPFY